MPSPRQHTMGKETDCILRFQVYDFLLLFFPYLDSEYVRKFIFMNACYLQQRDFCSCYLLLLKKLSLSFFIFCLIYSVGKNPAVAVMFLPLFLFLNSTWVSEWSNFLIYFLFSMLCQSLVSTYLTLFYLQ